MLAAAASSCSASVSTLREDDVAVALRGGLEDRGEGAARAAPRGPEVDEHDVVAGHRLVERGGGELDRGHGTPLPPWTSARSRRRTVTVTRVNRFSRAPYSAPPAVGSPGARRPPASPTSSPSSTTATTRPPPRTGTPSAWSCGDPGSPVRRILVAVDPVGSDGRRGARARRRPAPHPPPAAAAPGDLGRRDDARGVAGAPAVGGRLRAARGAHQRRRRARRRQRRARRRPRPRGDRPCRAAGPTSRPPGSGGSATSPRRPRWATFAGRVRRRSRDRARRPGRGGRRTAAASSGRGRGRLRAATRSGRPPLAGADVVVTSDLKHHVALDHRAAGGPALIDVAHFASEWPWVPLASGCSATWWRPATTSTCGLLDRHGSVDVARLSR